MYGLFYIAFIEHEFDNKELMAVSEDIDKLIKFSEKEVGWKVEEDNSLSLMTSEEYDKDDELTEYFGLSIEPIIHL